MRIQDAFEKRDDLNYRIRSQFDGLYSMIDTATVELRDIDHDMAFQESEAELDDMIDELREVNKTISDFQEENRNHEVIKPSPNNDGGGYESRNAQKNTYRKVNNTMRNKGGNADVKEVRQLREEVKNFNYQFDQNGTDTRDAFNRYLVHGFPGISDREYRALQADSDTAGGYMVMPNEMAKEVIVELSDDLFIRRLARGFTVPNAQSLGFPALDNDFGNPAWTSELSTGSTDEDLTLAKRDLYPHPAARRIKVSNKLLRASSLNPEGLVRERMIYRMSIVHENAFLNGTGVNQPLGIFVDSADGITATRDISTGNTQTAVTADGLTNAVGHMKASYRQGAIWIMHRDVETQISKLKDGEGRYLWNASLDGKTPNMLKGFPVYLSEYAPNTLSAGEYVAVLANLSFYFIVDALNMQIIRLNELYQESNQTGFIIRHECDAMPVLENAFVRVKLST